LSFNVNKHAINGRTVYYVSSLSDLFLYVRASSENSSTFIRLNINLNPVDTHWLNFGTKMDIFPVNEAVVKWLGENIFSTSFSA